MKVGVHRKMVRKKKVKRFRAVQAVKELARERMGAPPAGKVVPHKNKNPAKHKPTLGKLLGDVN
jgi:hypothetical protein